MENKYCLFVGFKGKRNSSGLLVTELSKSLSLSDALGLSNFCQLTNSIDGVKRDIDSIEGSFVFVIMFGCDKSLKSCVRIERFAERNGIKLETNLNLELLSRRLGEGGIGNVISETPTHYLCNEAYWYALQKFEGKAIFIHIPTLKNIDENLISKIKELKNDGILDGTFKSCR